MFWWLNLRHLYEVCSCYFIYCLTSVNVLVSLLQKNDMFVPLYQTYFILYLCVCVCVSVSVSERVRERESQQIVCRSLVTGWHRLQEDMKRKIACTLIRSDFYHDHWASLYVWCYSWVINQFSNDIVICFVCNSSTLFSKFTINSLKPALCIVEGIWIGY